jgi:tetratricopeptide (TPR) repeat protein
VSVADAREAAARGEWDHAYDLLIRADATGALTPDDLPLLAEIAYAAGHLDATIEAWERAYAECLHHGDRTSAAGAAVRVALHLLFDAALMSPVRGWLARAERLLEDHEETPAHAWLAVVRTYERILTGDLETATRWCVRAVEVGARCDPAAGAIARVASARLRILAGDVEEGIALLEESGVAAVSGELDPLSTGVVYCELVCALQGVAQYDVAEQWTEAMERWSRTDAIGSLHGRCRVHRAEILRLRGALDDAEREALAACEELRPYLRRELGWPLNELGRIRLRKGDIAGAEKALEAAESAGWDAQPGLALVRLARGDAVGAAVSIRQALERSVRAPSKELPPDTDLQRAPLLETQVEVEIAAGELGRAQAAADELERIAARFRSKALAAAATLSRGRVRLAEGDAAEAKGRCAAAASMWKEIGAPYEEAVARSVLADAIRTDGDDESATLETQAVRSTLEQVEIAAGTTADANVFRREGDSWSITFDGRTVRVRDLKGMRYLARLLAYPGRELHVLDLVAAETGHSVVIGDAGELLDERAKAAYRRRLTEIEDDIEQARSLGDWRREAQADTEREFLIRELARAVGLGGRSRRAGSASERARAAVTRAIRQAIARIGEHDAQLGEHLGAAVRTGTHCAYVPDVGARATWSS